MSLPTPETILRHYLFDSPDFSSSDINEDFIRPKTINEVPVRGTDIEVNMAEYMSQGGGRFANGVNSTLVSRFFTLDSSLFGADGEKRTFTISEMVALTQGDYRISLQQYNYADGHDDYIDRVFAWNSSGFKISDDSVFVVEADGTRHIQDFSIWAYDDNFDYESGDLIAGLAGSYLSEQTDPFGIGRRVDLIMTHKEDVPTYNYTWDHYVLDIARNAATFIIPSLSLLNGINSLIDTFRENNVTRFLDQADRPILYGTTEDDVMNVTDAIWHHNFQNYVNKGVVLVGGDGNDSLTAGQGQDLLIGGKGDDLFFVERVNLENAGAVLVGGDGDDKFFVEAISERGGLDHPTVIWGGAGANEYHFDGANVRIAIIYDNNLTEADVIAIDTRRIVSSNIDGTLEPWGNIGTIFQSFY